MFRPLGESWNEVLQRLPGNTQFWQFEHLCRELLEEDYRRRLFYKGNDPLRAPLHLQDWGSGGRKAVGSANAASGTHDAGENSASTGQAQPAQGRTRSPQKHTSQFSAPPSHKSHKVFPKTSKPRSFLLCFHCKQWGHRWNACSSLPTGWTPDDQRVQECMQVVFRERKAFRAKSPVKRQKTDKDAKSVSWRNPEVTQAA